MLINISPCKHHWNIHCHNYENNLLYKKKNNHLHNRLCIYPYNWFRNFLYMCFCIQHCNYLCIHQNNHYNWIGCCLQAVGTRADLMLCICRSLCKMNYNLLCNHEYKFQGSHLCIFQNNHRNILLGNFYGILLCKNHNN